MNIKPDLLLKLKITIFLIFFPQFALEAKSSPPPIQLSNIYNSNVVLEDYLISEKLDGLRGYWNGENLISKNGNIYNAPEWFIENFPKEVFEGELWIDRQKFEEVSGIVRRKNPDINWKKVKFMLFDLPKHKGTFEARFEAMKILVKKSDSKYLKVIPQFKVKNHQELTEKLDLVIKNGGEGLMLHKKDSFYQAIRNDDILKLKKFSDAEAIVLEHLEGKGKYLGMLGSILVENEQGVRFKIGGGFSDFDRKNPPPIGSIITYKFYDKTKNNKPKFASFLRSKDDYDFKRSKTN